MEFTVMGKDLKGKTNETQVTIHFLTSFSSYVQSHQYN